MKNNLFNYATSELSQDAFIAWLMSYAMKDSKKDTGLRNCAVSFIRKMIPELENVSSDNIFITEIQKQYKNIDILLTVNETYKIIIEDKTYTTTHDNQLKRYFDTISKEWPVEYIKCVVYKTGFDSYFDEMREEGYLVLDRKSIIEIFNEYKGQIHNDIFCDYIDYVSWIDVKADRYQNTNVSEWDWSMICAFYDSIINDSTIKRGMLDGDFHYDYVANPSGGVYALWLWPKVSLSLEDIEFTPYLQIEAHAKNESENITGKINIQLKISLEGLDAEMNTRQAAIRLKNILCYENQVNWKYNLEQFHFFKPKYLGSGKYTTIGSVWKEAESDINAEEIKRNFEKAICSFSEFFEYAKKCVYE